MFYKLIDKLKARLYIYFFSVCFFFYFKLYNSKFSQATTSKEASFNNINIDEITNVTNSPSQTQTSISSDKDKFVTNISVAAIDNGLAFPFKHPDEWRACKFS